MLHFQMLRYLEHIVENVDDMLAWLPCARAVEDSSRARIAGHVRNGDRVNIACGPGHLDALTWAVVMVGMAVFFNATRTFKHEHALLVALLESVAE